MSTVNQQTSTLKCNTCQATIHDYHPEIDEEGYPICERCIKIVGMLNTPNGIERIITLLKEGEANA